MATISQKEWKRYIARLRQINDKAAEEFRNTIIDKGGYGNIERQKLIDYAYGVSTKYGEASAALSAEMYDALAELSGATIPSAVPAEITYQDVAKTVNGIIKNTGSDEILSQGIGRLVKMAGTDTILSNAYRDRPKGSKRKHSGAQVAWIPSGDTCPFCLMLASKGWQYQTEWGANNHSEHIHANCDCTYAVRFDNNLDVEGYDPEKLREDYYEAGDNRKDRLNAMRREQYAENPEKYREQKKELYDEAKERRLRLEANSPFKDPDTPLEVNSYKQSKHILGGDKYEEYMKTHEYPPSYLTISEEEAQELVDKYHGTGILKLGRDGLPLPNEMIVDNDKVIGIAVNNNNGKERETTGFKIHYAKDGTHIVPMYQNQKEYWKERREHNGHDWLLRQKS